MNKTLHLTKNLTYFGIPLGLFGLLILLITSPLLKVNHPLSLAITIDLIFTVPLVYILLIRKTKIPKTTVIPILVLGILIGSYFLPEGNQFYLNLFKTWFLPIIELSILTFVTLKVHKALKTYKSIKGSSPDFFNALKATSYEILPKKLVLPFATELAVIYYGFINWKTRPLKENEFTYHKTSGTPAILGAFIFIIGIETVAFHFLLALWNSSIAWVFTALSLYTAIQILGFAKSLSKRPISLTDDSLNLKYGIMNETKIPLVDIEHVELSSKPLLKNKLTKRLSPLGELESHNLIIHLKRENELIGLYGIRHNFKSIGMHVDKANVLKEKIDIKLRPETTCEEKKAE